MKLTFRAGRETRPRMSGQPLAFTKMEGLGNDYIYVADLEQRINPAEFPAISRAVSERHFGIGADGLIVILPPEGDADFRMRIFNADGSEAQMCGNGIRCFARYVYDRGLTKKRELAIETLAGIIRPEIRVEVGRVTAVRVDMGEPTLERSRIPMGGEGASPVRDEPVRVGGRLYKITAVSMGNPHAVIFIDDVAAVDLPELGPALEHHPLFPERVNVHVVEIESSSALRMRTWERGSGITLACGTGACAVLVAAHLTGRAGRHATVRLPGGDLEIEWAENNRVYMTGPAEEVCSGTFTKGW